MNIHVPQDDSEKAEVTEFMLTPHHIVSAQNNCPIIGLIQDSLVGSFVLTKDTTFVDWETFCDACLSANVTLEKMHKTLEKAAKHYPDFIQLSKGEDKKGDIVVYGSPKSFKKTVYAPGCMYPKTFEKKEEAVAAHKANNCKRKNCGIHKDKTDGFVKLPGKVLFSVLLPDFFCYDKGDVRIEDGILLPSSGPLTKSDLGPKAGNSIVHLLWLERSEQIAAEFIENCQALIRRWFLKRNLSIGTEDCQLTQEGKVEVEKEKSNAIFRCTAEAKIKTGDELETSVTGILNSVVSIGQKLTKTAVAGGEENGFALAISSGAKGGFINLSQALAVVGQQNVEGARIKKLISGGQRCLPHFDFGVDGPDERGFISSSYYQGLKAIEAFFAAMGGREGIIDTAVKTADSGYLQRRLGHMLESCTVNTLEVVKKCNGKVVEFAYGGDGFNAARLTNVGDAMMFVDPLRLAREISLSSPSGKRKLSPQELDAIVEPLSLSTTPSMEKTAEEVRKFVKKRLENIEFAGPIEELRDRLFRLFVKSISPYGHSVGYEATCSIGEVQTQLTLNSFRLSGVGEKAVLTGVPRFRELMVASEKQKHSSCTVAVKCLDFAVNDEETKRKALKIAEEQRKVFEYRTVSDFVDGEPKLRYFFGKDEEFSAKRNASRFVEEELCEVPAKVVGVTFTSECQRKSSLVMMRKPMDVSGSLSFLSKRRCCSSTG
ncbi:hypothetical protein GMAR_ORF267 [Golden Marseillevirus]|uniref:hypothetical protein n=1 Tax=Golden Marseillevirus TaxID=1720526 RepID=UPI000877A8D4|nr:hypothetical protein GMAR_ORF267 [Golden Marseillevirus]ALX27641.1 hypothetical protein GMAR_ORF267 [Golden Marseillevirus]